MSSAPDADPAPPLPVENEALIGLGDWIGTTLGWQPGPAGQLVVTIAVDTDALEAGKTDALTLYRRIAAQLSGARNLQLAVSTSLDATTTPAPDETGSAAIASYASAVVAYLSDGGAPPAPVSMVYTIRQLAVAIPPLQVLVTATLSRETGEAVAGSASSIEQVTSPVPADSAGGLRMFAQRFRETFPTLRLAVDGRHFDPENPWAFEAQLIQPTIAGDPTVFAPAPLTKQSQFGTASVPNFGDFSQGAGWPATSVQFSAVDCDQLLADCFRALDRLQAEPLASALQRAAPDPARAIANARSRLATAYSTAQLHALFEPVPSDPTQLGAARAAYADALDESLVDAYAIDALLAFATTWSSLPGAWNGAGLSLLGSVQAREGDRSVSMASAKIRIEGATTPMGTLCYPFRPRNLTEQTESPLPPLEFFVTHIGAAEKFAGAPIWLALVEPETIPVGRAAGLRVPVVNRFQPLAPALTVQNAAPTAPASPAFSQLFQWDYSADVTLQPVAQDVAQVVVHYGGADPAAVQVPEQSALAAALFRFRTGFVAISPVLDDVVAGKPSAANIVGALADLVAPLQLGADARGAPELRVIRNGEGSSLPLAVTLTADPATPGQWQLTVAAEGMALPDTLAALPMTAEGMPQPNTAAVRTNPLVMAFQPRDATAAVVVRLSLRQLDLRAIEEAWTEAHVVRNVALRPASTTATRYILPSSWSGFPRAVTPFIAGPDSGYDLASAGTPPASGLLGDWLQMLVDTVFGVGPARRATCVVSYAYDLMSTPRPGGSDPLAVQVAVASTGLVTVGQGEGAITPTALASGLAQTIAAWVNATSPSGANARFVFDLTLMAAESEEVRPLLSISNLRLAVADVKGLA